MGRLVGDVWMLAKAGVQVGKWIIFGLPKGKPYQEMPFWVFEYGNAPCDKIIVAARNEDDALVIAEFIARGSGLNVSFGEARRASDEEITHAG